MSPNRKLLNLLILRKLTTKEFKELKKGLVITEPFLDDFFRIVSNKNLDKSILSEMAELIVDSAKASPETLKTLINIYREEQELSTFQEQVARKLKKIAPRPKELNSFLDFYAL